MIPINPYGQSHYPSMLPLPRPEREPSRERELSRESEPSRKRELSPGAVERFIYGIRKGFGKPCGESGAPASEKDIIAALNNARIRNGKVPIGEAESQVYAALAFADRDNSEELRTVEPCENNQTGNSQLNSTVSNTGALPAYPTHFDGLPHAQSQQITSPSTRLSGQVTGETSERDLGTTPYDQPIPANLRYLRYGDHDQRPANAYNNFSESELQGAHDPTLAEADAERLQFWLDIYESKSTCNNFSESELQGSHDSTLVDAECREFWNDIFAKTKTRPSAVAAGARPAAAASDQAAEGRSDQFGHAADLLLIAQEDHIEPRLQTTRAVGIAADHTQAAHLENRRRLLPANTYNDFSGSGLQGADAMHAAVAAGARPAAAAFDQAADGRSDQFGHATELQTTRAAGIAADHTQAAHLENRRGLLEALAGTPPTEGTSIMATSYAKRWELAELVVRQFEEEWYRLYKAGIPLYWIRKIPFRNVTNDEARNYLEQIAISRNNPSLTTTRTDQSVGHADIPTIVDATERIAPMVPQRRKQPQN